MSALGTPVLINPNRAYWLSSIGSDVVHSTITTQEIDAGIGRFSTVYVSDFLTTSTLNASSFTLTNLDLSNANISTLKTSNAFTSTLVWASGDASGTGQVIITTDPSGVSVDGDAIRFNNLVYFTSTITIVPVSTVVDQDIFAQRGFFSTLSSGSISTGNLQASNAVMSSLQVSSIVATDISGFSPSLWSLYPTLNSSITFSGGNQLSNVGNKIFFAGTELTDVSGGGQDWSLFPAQTDVSMNNFSLRQVSTLQYQDGARLYSQTGNNLFYNGQAITTGTQGNAAYWSYYPASTNINMAGFGIGTSGNLPIVAASNIALLAQTVSSVVDQGANIASYADYNITAQNGNKGRINMTANTGFQGLFGEINMTANGGTVAGVGTGGLITLTANTPVGTLCNATSAIKLSASGVNSYAGAIPPIGSLAGYNFIYGTGGVNICAGLPAALPNVPFTTFLYGTAGVTTSSDFYCPNIFPYFNGITTPPDLIISGRYITPNLAQVYVQLSNVKYLYMDGAAQIQNANLVSTVSTVGSVANFGTGQFGALAATNSFINTLNANNISTSFAQSPLFSTVNINLSTINGVNWLDISSSVTTVSSFNDLKTSSFKVSSMSGTVGQTGVGSTIFTDSGFQFTGETLTSPGGNRFLSSLRFINSIGGNLLTQASTNTISWTGGINPNGYVRIGSGGAFDSYFRTVNGLDGLSTQQLLSKSTIMEECVMSTVTADGGLPIKIKSNLQFVNPLAIDNCSAINLNSDFIQQLTIQASTILLGANNTTVQSLSTVRHSTASLSFSTATSVGSNIAYNYPLFIDYDQATNISTGGVAIAVQGHNFATGAVINRIEMGARGNGENYIASVWPGQNLEDLYIDATQVTVRDSDGFSTIINENPYGLATNGEVKVGTGSGIVNISTGLIKVGGQTNLTPTTISTTFMNTPYGNNMYYAGQQQPCIFHGKVNLPSGGGSVSSLITLPTAYTTKDFDVQLTYINQFDNTGLYWSTQTTNSFLAFGGGGKSMSWCSMGNLPFTG